MIGGALARPCISYPDLFPPGTIWDSYPYLLPNLFSAATVFIGVVVGFLFLEETHVAKRTERDSGLELGRRIARFFGGIGTCQGLGRNAEKQSLLSKDSVTGYDTSISSKRAATTDEPLPAYQSRESSPKLSPQAESDGTARAAQSRQASPKNDTKMKIFTKPVILNIISYGILAL